jgi:hypothetical protein
MTFGALTFVVIVGIWRANPDTLRDQPFLLDGSKGVNRQLDKQQFEK